jgi:hypothetical protein
MLYGLGWRMALRLGLDGSQEKTSGLARGMHAGMNGGNSRHRKDIYQRIFISYPISKNLQKGYFLSFFGAGYFEDIIS